MHVLKNGASKNIVRTRRTSLARGELTRRQEREIIEEVMIERIEKGGGTAAVVEYLLIVRGRVQSVSVLFSFSWARYPFSW